MAELQQRLAEDSLGHRLAEPCKRDHWSATIPAAAGLGPAVIAVRFPDAQTEVSVA